MSTPIKFSLTPQAEALVSKLTVIPADMVTAIQKAMDAANELAIANIKRHHIDGKGPFPVEQHKLGKVTGLLQKSVNATPAVASGPRVHSYIGSNVIYAAIHELGSRIHHEARQMKVRLRTDAHGNLIRQLKNSKLAMFARKSHARAKEITTEAKAYDVDMPARAPFRTGIEESAAKYKELMSAAVVRTWTGGKN